MSVYRPKKSPHWHYDFVWKGRRYYGSTGLASKRAAEAYETRVRHDAITGLKEKPSISLDEACGAYAVHAETLPSWSTIEGFLESLLAGIGKDKLLAEITQLDLQHYFARRRGTGVSNATINREIENARAVWRRVRNTHHIGEMPKWTELFLKVSQKPPRELSSAEEPGLFEALRSDVIDVCDFALKSGWRLSEVIDLRWSDCDLSVMQAATRIKGGDVVRRPLTATLVAIIAHQPKVGPFVFTYEAQKTKPEYVDKLGRKQSGRVKGQRYKMTKTALRKPFVAAKKAAGIENFRFHDLRHTRGTRIVRATGSLAAAKEALKHRHIKTTLRYAHVLDEDVRNALDASESRTIPERATVKAKKA